MFKQKLYSGEERRHTPRDGSVWSEVTSNQDTPFDGSALVSVILFIALFGVAVCIGWSIMTHVITSYATTFVAQ